ncbi:MAG: hypothetical protein EOM77_04915 [Bacteroidia bacterium]|nr:hypothetical protein [Bacteroidia bacterium]
MIKETSGVTSNHDVELQKSAHASIDELKSKYQISSGGYDDDQVSAARSEYGNNEIFKRKNSGLLSHLFLSFVNPFTIVLIVLTIISLITDIILADPSERNYFTVILVVIMVIISGLMKFIQESRSQKATEKLSRMVQTTATVMRDGQRREISISEIVVGDTVFLATTCV